MKASTTQDGPALRSTSLPHRRSRSRWLVALMMPVGPAAVAVLRFVLPYDTTDGAATVVAKVATHPNPESLVLWLGLVATLTLIPAVLWVARLTSEKAPGLTVAALLLLVPGYVSLAWVVARDALLWAGVHRGVDAAVLTRLYSAVHPASGVAEGLFVVGHVGGTVLLGMAMWRSRAVPRWAAALTLVSQPLHLFAAVIVVSHPLDLVAWSLNAVGFAAAAASYLRVSDEARWASPGPSMATGR